MWNLVIWQIGTKDSGEPAISVFGFFYTEEIISDYSETSVRIEELDILT
jgi:hypothetical protein